MAIDSARPLRPRGPGPTRFSIRSSISTTAGHVVASGPFVGMRYASGTTAVFLPKLLGTYELELHEAVRECAGCFSLIINVGAADGYYAVGLARADPRARVVAFEMEADRRELLGQIAVLNGVAERVEIHAAADATALSEALGSGDECLVVVDVEGAEETILDPAAVPGLKSCTIVVEIHPHAVAGIDKTLRDRFGSTHEIEEIWEQPRTADHFPLDAPIYMRLLFSDALVNTMRERRPERMRWFVMRPRSFR